MRVVSVLLAATWFCLFPVSGMAGNAHPYLYPEIYGPYDNDPDDPGPPPAALHGHVDSCPVPDPSDLLIPCYVQKVPYTVGCVALHVGNLDQPTASGWPPPCSPGGGYVEIRCGILRTGHAVTYLGLTACPGFVQGPGIAPGAIDVYATTKCHDWPDHPFYVKYLNTTGSTSSYFNITTNADDGQIRLKNCQGSWETPTIGGQVEWGGTKTILCLSEPNPCELGPTCQVTPDSLEFGNVPLGTAVGFLETRIGVASIVFKSAGVTAADIMPDSSTSKRTGSSVAFNGTSNACDDFKPSMAAEPTFAPLLPSHDTRCERPSFSFTFPT